MVCYLSAQVAMMVATVGLKLIGSILVNIQNFPFGLMVSQLRSTLEDDIGCL